MQIKSKILFFARNRKTVLFFLSQHKRSHILSSVVWCKVQGHLRPIHHTLKGWMHGQAHCHSFCSCWTTSCISTISAHTKTMNVRPTTNLTKPNSPVAILSVGTTEVKCGVSYSRSGAERMYLKMSWRTSPSSKWKCVQIPKIVTSPDFLLESTRFFPGEALHLNPFFS